MNTGRLQITGYPRREDRCEDRVTAALTMCLVLEKRFERRQANTPLHHTTIFQYGETTILRKNHGLFCSRGQTSCDFIARGARDEFLLHTNKFRLIDFMPRKILQKKKNQAAVALSKLGASKGGKARAATLSAAERSRIAKLAAQARWNKV